MLWPRPNAAILVRVMRRWGWVLLAALGCGVGLEVDEGAAIACERDADCPEDWRCGARGLCIAPGGHEDLAPPRIVTAEASGSSAVVITFNEPIAAASAGAPASYSITPALPIAGVTVEAQSVRLFTGEHSLGVVYDLVVRDVRDLAGNEVAASGLVTTFTGGGVPPDPTPPDPLGPADETRFFDRNIVLAWTPRFKAASYSVELSLEADFDPLWRAAIDVTEPSLDVGALTGPGLTARSYFWRVRADVTDGAATLPVRRFHVMDSVIYVHCPADPCDAEARIGNLSAPHENVSRALVDAAANGLREVRVAARGGDLAYRGAVSLLPGVSLLGGYAADFSSRDPTTLPTILEHDGQFVVGAISITADSAPEPGVVLEGFTIRTMTGSNLVDSSAVYVNDCDGSLTIRGNVVRSDDAAGFSRGVQITSAYHTELPLLITDNDIAAGRVAWGHSIGVSLEFSTAHLVGNRAIRGNDTIDSSSFGVFANASQLLLEDNALIAAGQSPRESIGARLAGVSGAVRGNVIVAGNASTTTAIGFSTGLEVQARIASEPLVIEDNDIATGSGVITQGMLLESWSELTATGNRVSAGAASHPTQLGPAVAYSIGIALRNYGSFVVGGNTARAGDVSAGTAPTSEIYSAGLAYLRQTTGVALRPASARIFANLALGGAVSLTVDSPFAAASYGIKIDSPQATVTLYNNVARAGEASATATAASVGVLLATRSNSQQTSTHAVGVNNTIVAGGATSSTALGRASGIELQPPVTLAATDVLNNLVLTRGAADSRLLLRELGACSGSCPMPRSLRNNLLLHLAPSAGASLYRDGDGTLIDDGNGDGLLDELAAVGTTVADNRTVTSAIADWLTLFVDPDGTLTPDDPWDDFAPAAGSPALGVGRNFYDPDRLHDDIRGTERPACATPPCDSATPAWSAGAHED